MVSGQHERTCMCVLMASESDDSNSVREKKSIKSYALLMITIRN